MNHRRAWRHGAVVGRHALALGLASLVVFAVTRAMPQSPMEVYLADHGLPVTPENVAAVRRAWGLDGPLWHQYLTWLGGLVRGDWGTSVVSGVSVRSEMASRVPLSLALGLGGLTLGAVGAYALGMAAETRGWFWAAVSRGLAVVAQSVPSFATATVVIMVLGVSWRVVPFYTLSSPEIVVAPMLVLAAYTAAQLSRVAAATARSLRTEPFVRAAVGRGFDEAVVLRRQGRRQVWYAIVSAMVAKMSWAIGGTAVLEVVFAVPGMSQFLVTRIQQRDYLVLQTYLIFMVVWMMVSHLVLEGVLILLAPGTREEGS